jgi:hypothetical protein
VKSQRFIPATMFIATVIAYGLLALIMIGLHAAHFWPAIGGGQR